MKQLIKIILGLFVCTMFFSSTSMALNESGYNKLRFALVELAKLDVNVTSPNAMNNARSNVEQTVKHLRNQDFKDEKLLDFYDTVIKKILYALSEKDHDLTLQELVGVMQALDAPRLSPISFENKLALIKNLVMGTQTLKTVAVIGRTRAGKSTAIATLVDPLDEKLHESIAKESLFSFTVLTKDYFTIVQGNNPSELYAVRFVDTPGLSEVKSLDQDEKRDDETIIKIIIKGLMNKRVDHVFHVMGLSEGLIQEDIDAFSLLKTALLENAIFKRKIDIVLSRMESDRSGERLKSLIQDLKMVNLPSIMRNELFPEQGDEKGEIFAGGTIFSDSFYRKWKTSIMHNGLSVMAKRNKILSHLLKSEISEYLECQEKECALPEDVKIKLLSKIDGEDN